MIINFSQNDGCVISKISFLDMKSIFTKIIISLWYVKIIYLIIICCRFKYEII